MTCKHCGTDIAAKALICYRCGRPTSEPAVAPPAQESLFAGRRRSRLPLVLLVITVVVVLAAWFLLGVDSGAAP